MKKYKFTIRGTVYEVEIGEENGNILNIDVNGTPYEVEVHREQKVTKTPTIIRKEVVPVADKPAEAAPSAPLKQVLAPLPGNILKTNVKEGDAVKKGDSLLIMEAMKMENNVLAEFDGIIRVMKIKEGDTVLQGDVLIEIE